MRSIAAITLLLAACGWIGLEINLPNHEICRRVSTGEWRRTVDGWQKVVVNSDQITFTNGNASAYISGDFWACHPHPIVWTLLVALLSVLVLTAFDAAAPRHNV